MSWQAMTEMRAACWTSCPMNLDRLRLAVSVFDYHPSHLSESHPRDGVCYFNSLYSGRVHCITHCTSCCGQPSILAQVFLSWHKYFWLSRSLQFLDWAEITVCRSRTCLSLTGFLLLSVACVSLVRLIVRLVFFYSNTLVFRIRVWTTTVSIGLICSFVFSENINCWFIAVIETKSKVGQLHIGWVI